MISDEQSKCVDTLQCYTDILQRNGLREALAKVHCRAQRHGQHRESRDQVVQDTASGKFSADDHARSDEKLLV